MIKWQGNDNNEEADGNKGDHEAREDNERETMITSNKNRDDRANERMPMRQGQLVS